MIIWLPMHLHNTRNGDFGYFDIDSEIDKPNHTAPGRGKTHKNKCMQTNIRTPRSRLMNTD